MAAKKGQKIIGRRAKYTGQNPHLRDVIVVAAMIDDGSGDPDKHVYATSNAEIVAAGGVKPTDFVEVQPILPDGHTGFVTYDALYSELDFQN